MLLTGSDEHFKLTKFGKFHYFESLISMKLQKYDFDSNCNIVYLAPS